MLIAFDPLGRGEVPVKLFQAAAEKYGFIVTGSNNSRNFGAGANAIQIYWTEITQHYPIDPRRIYVTGFSGGSRVAAIVVNACKTCVAGVIGCSAATSGDSGVLPLTEWFMAAGTIDFNYSEVLQFSEAAAAKQVANRFVVFEGPHSWMPPEVAEESLAWLQLRAMLKGTVAVDKDFLEAQYKHRLEKAQQIQQQGDVYAAARAYQELADDFRTLRDVKEVENTLKTIVASSDYKKAKKGEREAMDLQEQLSGKLVTLTMSVLSGNGDRSTLMTDLASQVSDMRSDEKRAANNLSKKRAIDRAMASGFAFAVERGQDNMVRRNYDTAIEMFQVASAVLPDPAWPNLLMASAYAQSGNSKHAMEQLRKATDKGFHNPKALEDSDFDKIRNDPGFKELVAKLSTPPSEPKTK